MSPVSLKALLEMEAKATVTDSMPTRHMQPAASHDLSIYDEEQGGYIISGRAVDVQFYAEARHALRPLAESLAVAMEALESIEAAATIYTSEEQRVAAAALRTIRERGIGE